MRFVLMPPSLEHRALIKVAVTLWNQKDVRALIAEFSFEDGESSDDEWKEIEEKVTEKVLQLSLPKLLIEKLLGCIKPIGAQIYEWIDFHCRRYALPLSLSLKLCWTAQGTVDRKRTAEVLVRDQSLGIATRYKLACVYCLEEDIIAVWNTLSEDLKQSFLFGYSPNIAEWDGEWMIIFWSGTMKGKWLGNARISYKEEFMYCVRKGNKAAAEYFLQKLTPRDREESLVQTAKTVEDCDTLSFLLSQMNEWQQMEVFKDNPRRVLNCFLQWPWQSFFMEIANCMWNFIPQDVYECLLIEIIYKVINGYKDWGYHKLFREFWQKRPDVLKSLIANDLTNTDLLPALCCIKDKEIIRLIHQDATLAAREKLIYSDEMHSLCQDWILGDEWDFLEFVIQECLPSKNEMLNFKEVFENRKKWKWVEEVLLRNKDKWDKIFLSSDDSLREYEKRNADEGESSSSKRFRSLE